MFLYLEVSFFNKLGAENWKILHFIKHCDRKPNHLLPKVLKHAISTYRIVKQENYDNGFIWVSKCSTFNWAPMDGFEFESRIPATFKKIYNIAFSVVIWNTRIYYSRFIAINLWTLKSMFDFLNTIWFLHLLKTDNQYAMVWDVQTFGLNC